ncbi:MFS transporter [Archaeoglobus fulgidus]|jgi:D-galactonate transporter|uniref:Hexuronate transporter (ExuT) n=3 Tax=Archaeoglobus fulgidus TaxID=2234 RepID=O30222_ARCFU|nr:MFS transporter [Archaeoglobus fulgidus]AAB91217.1 hexuronate transporter (exuT) [Archaeoglobus fulgidus DSM 4304]AIG96857.1 Sugar phosphate permease [Archaeoglobus fulgidus DSM 8774]KUJ94563.1 MAG: Hexuronate transporter (ExuT) [Archaeoglobus fulgidus]KUK06025.1 MAG: Hexuronate transporter (ExuT) [Archaeoglobus fulgidus]
MGENSKFLPWMVATGAMLAFTVRWLHYLYSFTAPQIMDEFGVPAATASLMVTANSIGMVVGGFLIGVLCDKIGVRVTLSIAAVVVGVFTIFVGYAQSIYMAIVMFGIAGLFSWLSSAFPKIARAWFPPSLYSTANSYMFLGFRLSALFMGPVVASIVITSGWRSAWIDMGILCILMGVLAFALIRDKKDVQVEQSKVSVGEVFKYRDAWILFGAYSMWLIGCVMYVVFTITYLQKGLQLDPMTSGWLWSLLQLVGIISMYTLLPLSDLLASKGIISRKNFAGIMFLVASVAFFIFGSLKPGMPITYYAASIVLVGLGALLLTTIPAPLISERFPPNIAGTATGFITAVGQWPFIVMPPIAGMLAATYGWGFIYQVSAPFIAIGGMILILLMKPPQKVSA